MKTDKTHILLYLKSSFHELILMKELQAQIKQCTVTSVQSHNEAIRVLNSEKIDVAVIDIESDYFDDINNLQEIKSFQPKMPIIAVVNKKEKELSNKLLKIGISEVIQKNDVLHEVVSELIKSILVEVVFEDDMPEPEPSQDQIDHLSLTASVLSHEINNPLMTILGITELILDVPDGYDKNLVKKIKAIQNSALRIKKSTHRITNIVTPVYQKTPYGVIVDPKKSRIYTKSKVKLTETE